MEISVREGLKPEGMLDVVVLRSLMQLQQALVQAEAGREGTGTECGKIRQKSCSGVNGRVACARCVTAAASNKQHNGGRIWLKEERKEASFRPGAQ